MRWLHAKVHAQVDVILDLLKGLGRRTRCGLHLLCYSEVPFSVLSLLLQVLIVLCLVLFYHKVLVYLFSVIDLKLRIYLHGGAFLEPLGQVISSSSSFRSLGHSFCSREISLVLINEVLVWCEVVRHGLWTSVADFLLAHGVACAHDFDGDAIDATE